MNIDIPPNPSGMSQIADAIEGRTATDASKTEPGRLIRLTRCER